MLRISATCTVAVRCCCSMAFRHRSTPAAEISRPCISNPCRLSLITLHLIDEMLDVDLHGWTPVRDRSMRCRQYTSSSHATTPESNKSDTGNGAWTPQTPDGIQAGPTFKRSGEDCRCFVIVAIRYTKG